MSALLADYERLATMQACFDRQPNGSAVFEIEIRHLPPDTGYLVAAGLEQVIQYLRSFSFSEAESAWLEAVSPPFSPQFLAYAKGLRFDGDVDAMPEGSIFFANEPVLRLSASLPLAQYLETQLLGVLRYEVAVCSWASRLVAAADGRPLIDSSLGFASTPESAALASRAAYLAGFAATTSTDACRRFRIPLARALTVPGRETGPTAFEANLSQAQPDFVRLVGDDLPPRAGEMRSALDRHGLHRVKVLVGGRLDGARIAALVAGEAPIDAFGPEWPGPQPADPLAPDAVYALQRPASPDPATPLPGGRQVWREFAADGTIVRDTLTLDGEPGPPAATPLLRPAMRGGRRVGRAIALDDSRAHHAAQRLTLPPAVVRPAATPSTIEVLRSERLAATLRERPSVRDPGVDASRA